MLDTLLRKSWVQFDHDPILSNWIAGALPHTRASVRSDEFAKWLRYDGTWFAGVNALSNDGSGAVGSSGPLVGEAVDFIHNDLGWLNFEWDEAQVSVCYPGYPRPSESETDGAFQFRLQRDAAHVDGLHPIGPDRRRHLREYHSFILGIPMVDFESGASPCVVWEGSHEFFRQAFLKRFKSCPPELWQDEDITEIYRETRRTVFDQCPRVEIHARPGEAFIVHRLALHGMARWAQGAQACEDGRMICYFRPQAGTPETWLTMP